MPENISIRRPHLGCSPLSDLNKGIPRYHWSKLSGDGTVTFSANDSAAASNCTATFSAPGTYVVQLACDDGSIMDSTTWKWGYAPADSKNHTHIIGAVYRNITVKVEGSSPAGKDPTNNQ